MSNHGQRGTCFNVIPDYLPLIQKCATGRLWILHQGRWWGSYDWTYEFGVSWLMGEYSPELRNPEDLLRDGYAIAGDDPGKLQRCMEFEGKIKQYYLADKDNKLLRSMESGMWVR